MAPVGTGKTLVLAERAANAIREGIDPRHILCMTFTNRAAKEMQERIRKIFPKDADKITVSTFHALCAAILRMEANEIGLPRDFMVYDEVDSIDYSVAFNDCIFGVFQCGVDLYNFKSQLIYGFIMVIR